MPKPSQPLTAFIVDELEHKLTISIESLVGSSPSEQAYHLARISGIGAVIADPTYLTLSKQLPAVEALQDTADIIDDNLGHLSDADAKSAKSDLGKIRRVIEIVRQLQ